MFGRTKIRPVKNGLKKDKYIMACVCVCVCVCQCVCVCVCEQVLFVRFYNNPALVIRSMQFHYCTGSNPGTGADDAFVLKRGVKHSRPAIAASARHFQICFLS